MELDSYQKLVLKIISEKPGIDLFSIKEKSGFLDTQLKDVIDFLINEHLVFCNNDKFYLEDLKLSEIEKKNKQYLSYSLLLAILVSLFFFANTCNSYAYAPHAPNIKGIVFNPKLSGYKYINLNKIHKKVIIINFWATWCPPCRAEIPMLNSFYKKNNKNVLIIGVNVNVLKNGVKNFVDQFDNGLTYPIVHANILELQNYGGISEIPQSFFIMHHRIVFHWTGELNKQLLKTITSKILSYESGKK
jgi:thiol-disulfide isomerase/thioredoxin